MGFVPLPGGPNNLSEARMAGRPAVTALERARIRKQRRRITRTRRPDLCRDRVARNLTARANDLEDAVTAPGADVERLELPGLDALNGTPVRFRQIFDVNIVAHA